MSNIELIWNPELEPLLDDLDMVARQPALPAIDDASTLFANPVFSEHQTVDAEAFAQTVHEQRLGLRADSSPKDVLSNAILTLDGGALPTSQPINGYPPDFTLGQMGCMFSEPVPLASRLLDTPTTQVTHSISTSPPSSNFERGSLALVIQKVT